MKFVSAGPCLPRCVNWIKEPYPLLSGVKLHEEFDSIQLNQRPAPVIYEKREKEMRHGWELFGIPGFYGYAILLVLHDWLVTQYLYFCECRESCVIIHVSLYLMHYFSLYGWHHVHLLPILLFFSFPLMTLY